MNKISNAPPLTLFLQSQVVMNEECLEAQNLSILGHLLYWLKALVRREVLFCLLNIVMN